MTDITPRFLLLQARNDGDKMAAHELQCFVETLGVSADTIVTYNLLHGVPPESLWRDADALLMGGSGDYSLVKPIPVFQDFLRFLDQVVLQGRIPTFASCFGFQAIVVAGGGTLVHDPDQSEVGTYTLELTDAGVRDPLFGKLDRRFKAQLGHKDSAIELPTGMTTLATSMKVAHHALRVDGLPVVATQFHPELSKEANILRYQFYWTQVWSGTLEDDPVMQSMGESPETSDLLRRWMTDELIPELATRR